MTAAMLSVQNISKKFDNVSALDNCSLEIPEGIIAGLIGPNGAGKSTLVNVITGVYPPTSGRIFFKDQDISELSSYKIARLGLGRTFQIPRALLKMTVLENLKLAAPAQPGESFYKVWLRPGQVKQKEREVEEKALEILDFLNLTDLKDDYCDTLSGGQKKLLEIGRTMMADSHLILMDEPLAGVNPALGEEITEYLLELKEEGLTLMIIEHNVKSIMDLSDTVYVMNEGKIIARDEPEQVQQDQRVIEAYLGSEEH